MYFKGVAFQPFEGVMHLHHPCQLVRLLSESSRTRGMGSWRGAGSGLRVNAATPTTVAMVTCRVLSPRRGPSRPPGRESEREREMQAFQASVHPQRRGGSRATRTFVPVDPGRAITETRICSDLVRSTSSQHHVPSPVTPEGKRQRNRRAATGCFRAANEVRARLDESRVTTREGA